VVGLDAPARAALSGHFGRSGPQARTDDQRSSAVVRLRAPP